MSPFRLLTALVLLAAAVSAADHQDSQAEETVTGALTEVFNKFGDIATAVYKVQLTQDSTQGAEGRGKMGKMAIPLILGFKVSGAIVAAIAALKVLVLKTMALSGLALLASAGVALKYVYDKMHENKHEVHHQAAATPYYYAPAVQEMAWDTSYDVATAHSDISASQQPADLQGHYSSPVLQAATVNQTSYSFVPAVQVAQRKILRGPVPYKRTVYKTVHIE